MLWWSGGLDISRASGSWTLKVFVFRFDVFVPQGFKLKFKLVDAGPAKWPSKRPSTILGRSLAPAAWEAVQGACSNESSQIYTPNLTHISH